MFLFLVSKMQILLELLRQQSSTFSLILFCDFIIWCICCIRRGCSIFIILRPTIWRKRKRVNCNISIPYSDISHQICFSLCTTNIVGPAGWNVARWFQSKCYRPIGCIVIIFILRKIKIITTLVHKKVQIKFI